MTINLVWEEIVVLSYVHNWIKLFISIYTIMNRLSHAFNCMDGSFYQTLGNDYFYTQKQTYDHSRILYVSKLQYQYETRHNRVNTHLFDNFRLITERSS